jgi:AcrR family transcriptional regulator
MPRMGDLGCLSERFAPFIIKRSDALRKLAYTAPVTRPARRRGRYLEAERNDLLVLQAAREVFAALGADAPVSAVAQRAGVGMGSLYRRYGSKTALLQRLCILAMEEAANAAEVALSADDAWGGLAEYIRTCVAFGSGALAPLAGTIETTPEMWELSRRGRQLVEQIVARAHADGALRADVTTLDIAWLIEHFGRHGPDRHDAEAENVRHRLLAIALDGLRAQLADPLPGTPPSAQHYEQRWKGQVP